MAQKVWEWVTTNIAPLLTASNIALVIGALFALRQAIKKIFGKSTEATLSLNERVLDIKTVATDTTQLKAVMEQLKKEAEDSKKINLEFKELLEALVVKTDAVLEIQDTAYGATKISEVRDLIKNTYANARFKTTQQREKIAKGAKEAAAKINELAETMKEKLVEIEHTAAPTASSDSHVGGIVI